MPVRTRTYTAMSHMHKYIFTPTVVVSFFPEILHAPESTTIFLNQSAVFTCETRVGITSWRVNGTQREILLDEIRSDLVVSESPVPGGTTVHTLTIPVRAQYNGTRVQCLSVTIGGPYVESDNVTLTIQGITPPTVCYPSTCVHFLCVCLLHAQSICDVI